jgi:hypothetical protein
VQECHWCHQELHDWADYRTWQLSPSAILFFHLTCFRACTEHQETAQSRWISAQFYGVPPPTISPGSDFDTLIWPTSML